MIDWVSIVRHSRRRFSNYVGSRSPVRIRRRRRQLAAPPPKQQQPNTATTSQAVTRKTKSESSKAERQSAAAYACCCSNNQRTKGSANAATAVAEIAVEAAPATDTRATNNRLQSSAKGAEDAVSSTSTHLNAHRAVTTATTATVLATSIYNFNLLQMASK